MREQMNIVKNIIQQQDIRVLMVMKIKCQETQNLVYGNNNIVQGNNK